MHFEFQSIEPESQKTGTQREKYCILLVRFRFLDRYVTVQIDIEPFWYTLKKKASFDAKKMKKDRKSVV